MTEKVHMYAIRVEILNIFFFNKIYTSMKDKKE